MIFPKLTRKRLYAAEGKPIEITWPDGEPKVGHSYKVETKASGRRRDLGMKVMVKARREQGEKWKATVTLDADPVRLLGRRAEYTESHQGAISTRIRHESAIVFRAEMEPEAVDEFTQERLTREAKDRDVHRSTETAADLLAAMEDLRSAIDGMEEGKKRRISRTLWQLRSRLDSAERELRRRLAA